MSTCDLSIVLEQPEATFQPGDRIAGFVGVEVGKHVKARKLTLALVGRTHGKGNRWEKRAAEVDLFTGEWQAGAQQLYPFEVTAPNGPLSYDGEIVSIEWSLRATVDIPWGWDPENSLPIELVARPDREPAQGTDLRRAGEEALAQLQGPLALVFAVFIGGFGLAPWIMFGAVDGLGGMPWPVIGFLCFWTSIAWSIGLVAVFAGMRNSIAERKLGPVTVTVSPERASPGEEVVVTFRCTPPAPVKVRSIETTLVGEEVAVKGSGTSKSTHTHVILKEVVQLCAARSLSDDTVLECRFTLPADAPASFAVSSNKLAWHLSTRVDLPLWPDRLELTPLIVLPAAR